MDGNIGSIFITADQISFVNPLFILILVPLFESWIYPAFKKAKCGLLATPLRRMGCGGILCALSFVISGILQVQLKVCIGTINQKSIELLIINFQSSNKQSTNAIIPDDGFTQLRFINDAPCSVTFNYSQLEQALSMINPSSWHLATNMIANETLQIEARVSAVSGPCGNIAQPTWKGEIKGENQQVSNYT